MQRLWKWLSFAVFCHFWVFHREIIKYSCRTWSSCRTLNLVNKVLFKVTSERTHICSSKIFKLQIYGSENARFPLKILIDRQEEGTHRPSWNIQGAAFNKISPQYNSLGFSYFNNSFGRKHVLMSEHICQAMKWDLAINHNNPWRTSTTCEALNRSINFIGIKKRYFSQPVEYVS